MEEERGAAEEGREDMMRAERVVRCGWSLVWLYVAKEYVKEGKEGRVER